MKPFITQRFYIEGPAGRLDTILGKPEGSQRGIAIIAHPHPLYGGTMDNKVVHTLFNTLIELGYVTAKFNFRGVGSSEGNYDQGVGEVDDVISVTQAIHKQFNNQLIHQPLILAGFSFGGAIQLLAAQQLNPQHLILVAPSIAHLNVSPPTDQTRQTLIIHGDQDDIVPLQTILKWAEPQSLPIVVIPGAEHFFHGRLAVLKRIIHNTFSFKTSE